MLVTSYAYYTFSGATTAFNVNTYNEYINVSFESSEIINTTTALPISDDEVDTLASSNNFIVNVIGGSEVAEVLLSISLININIDDALKNVDFKYQLLHNGNIIKEGTGMDFDSSSYELTSKEVIYSDSNNNFTFRVWISDNGLDQSDMENKVFSASIEVNAVRIRNTGEEFSGTLNSIIGENAILDTNINFNSISSDTNGKGVYIRSGTENDTYPIYYYRGDVDDNNVIFADMCFKIVRTTETGGVKLIYNGLPTNGTCNNTGTSSQIGTSTFNPSDNSPAYVGYMYGTVYERSSKNMSYVTDTYYYGNDVTYSNGTYTLTDTISSSRWSSIYNGGLNNYHYTCMGGTTCDEVYYIYYTNNSTMNYVTLTNGKKIEDALSDMLDNNVTSSTIKGNNNTSGTLDYWYYTNILQKGYSSYVEDTVWCNNRSIYDLGGWNPDGGTTAHSDNKYNYIVFGVMSSFVLSQPSFSCTRDIDKFTVNESNGNGDLDYPVGLLTADEVVFAGGGNTGNNSYYLYTGSAWWVNTPYMFLVNSSDGLGIDATGSVIGNNVGSIDIGIRPSISLRSNIVVSSGDGSVNSPYIINS